jgi:hypothetical protein
MNKNFVAVAIAFLVGMVSIATAQEQIVAVPDPVSTVVMLGLAVTSLSLLARKRN